MRKPLPLKTILLITALLSVYLCRSQILINEFSASNASIVEDPEYSNYSDWIELYNAGSESVNLNGYFITDNLDSPAKFQILTNVSISAGGYLIIWADGNNSGLHTNFKLSAEGEEIGVFDSGLELVDSLKYSTQKADVSMGRKPDGESQWSFFTDPTPGAANTTKAYNGFVTNMPEFSTRGGMYTSSVAVELFTDLGGEIRYTTNGAEPSENSTLYTGELNFSKVTILRARVFKQNLVPGPVVTQSYFINENSENGKLPVVSLATHPDNFWDANKGIFVQDFKPLWEVPVNIELFENNGSDRAAFNVSAGTKVNGLWSWQLPQKMLGVYFKKQYGDNKLDYPLFAQRNRNSYKSFALRASGSDWSFTLMRDMLAHHAILYNMNVDIMSYKPASMFLNGKFLGITNMREKVDDDYIEKSYGLEKGTFDLIENEEYVEAGNLDAYNSFHDLLHADLSVQGNFDQVVNLMDIENFTDYVITEMAMANTSISHNVMAWKPQNEGKWRWILMDLDRGGFHVNDVLIDFYIDQEEWPLRDLFDNPGYRTYFGKRLAAQLFTTFNSGRMIALIDEHKELIEDEIPRHVERWLGTTSDYGDAMPSVDYWYDQVDQLKNFTKSRPQALLNDLKNYGFEGAVALSLATMPNNGGQLYLDGLKVPQGLITGHYLKDVDFVVQAKPAPGNRFVGWSNYSTSVLLASGAEWKYLDDGSDQGDRWIQLAYNDAGWKTGKAELGYGDGDENTEVGFGGNADSKYVTTYFRKVLSLNESQIKASAYNLNLKFDDGAIVYVNGVEVVRYNMASGNVTSATLATDWVSGDAENNFYSSKVDKNLFVEGENIIAVEVHQGSVGSSDLSFDLELSAVLADTEIISTNQELNLNIVDDEHLIAVFEQNTACVVPSVVTQDIILSEDCSPYLVQGDVYVQSGATIIIEPGVEVLMPEGASLWVNGAIIAEGTSSKPVTFKLNVQYGGTQWGIIGIKNSTDTSYLKNVIIENASMGPDPVIDIGAISVFNASVVLDGITLVNNHGNPIMARYANVKLSNSHLHSDITGDLINVKYGTAHIENCLFEGNNQPDTDAIDYDEITNGVIRSCEVRNFHGFNSDAVDIGENAKGIVIDSLWVYSITDKGVSIGQRSTALIQNSVFVNCNLGVAIKDSSHVKVDKSVFYGSGKAIAAFEKNEGKAGGNVIVTNSILSNSSENAHFADSESKMELKYCLSDTDELSEDNGNVNGNPYFIMPNSYNFALQTNSPAINSGIKNNVSIDMGTKHPMFSWEQNAIICQLFVDPLSMNLPEFIGVYNPNNYAIDVSGYAISKGVTAVVPSGTELQANDTMYFISNKNAYPVWMQNKLRIQWTDGKLSNNGEGVQLDNKYGIAIDYIRYSDDGTWPIEAFVGNNVLTLTNANLDNHFGENWTTDSIGEVVDSVKLNQLGQLAVYPNPSNGIYNISVNNVKGAMVQVRNISGQLIHQSELNAYGMATINITNYPSGVYFIVVNELAEKIVLYNN